MLCFNFLFWNQAEVALRNEAFKICCAFNFFFRLKAQFHTLNLILLHFDRNIDKCQAYLANYLLFQSKIAKNAVFALCSEISIAEVRLSFNLVRKCHSAITELRYTSTESKSSLQKLRCVSESKKIAHFALHFYWLKRSLRFWYNVTCATSAIYTVGLIIFHLLHQVSQFEQTVCKLLTPLDASLLNIKIVLCSIISKFECELTVLLLD